MNLKFSDHRISPFVIYQRIGNNPKVNYIMKMLNNTLKTKALSLEMMNPDRNLQYKSTAWAFKNMYTHMNVIVKCGC